MRRRRKRRWNTDLAIILGLVVCLFAFSTGALKPHTQRLLLYSFFALFFFCAFTDFKRIFESDTSPKNEKENEKKLEEE